MLKFYNERRRGVASARHNAAHTILAELESVAEVQIITQNIDNLHEQAGSTHVMHLHGEITKACSSSAKRHVTEIGYRDIEVSELCPDGHQLRPFIVWFGEDVAMIPAAVEVVSQADVLLIIGTSLEVYPAASLVNYAPINTPVYVVDPNKVMSKIHVNNKVIHIQKGGSEGMKDFASLVFNRDFE